MPLLLKFALLWIVGSLVAASLLSRFWPRRKGTDLPRGTRTVTPLDWRRG